jgi:hypothetical protein
MYPGVPAGGTTTSDTAKLLPIVEIVRLMALPVSTLTISVAAWLLVLPLPFDTITA